MFSNVLPQKRQNHIGCICLTSLHCAFSVRLQIAFLLRCKVTLVLLAVLFSNVYSNESSNGLYEKRHSHIGYIYVDFLRCVFFMVPQRTCIRACIVALVAFVRFFSTVCFQMCPQIACIRGCKVTMVAFVWLFSTVNFQMSPQIFPLGGVIFTQVAFVSFCPITKVIFAMINIHDFPQFDASSFAASVQLAQKRKTNLQKQI